MTAVMQPYLFPYPGYFQLVHAADTFVFYDDVQFIQQGYINRNRLAGGPFVVPLTKASHTALIRERSLHTHTYGTFLRKWYKTFRLNYHRAPHYEATLELARRTFEGGADTIAELAAESVRQVATYLDLGAEFLTASGLTYDRSLTGQARLLNLLDGFGEDAYVNASGGSDLYQAAAFAERGIQLHFLQPRLAEWPDHNAARFSILHLLAHHAPERARTWIAEYYTLQKPQLSPHE